MPSSSNSVVVAFSVQPVVESLKSQDDVCTEALLDLDLPRIARSLESAPRAFHSFENHSSLLFMVISLNGVLGHEPHIDQGLCQAWYVGVTVLLEEKNGYVNTKSNLTKETGVFAAAGKDKRAGMMVPNV